MAEQGEIPTQILISSLASVPILSVLVSVSVSVTVSVNIP